MNSSSQTKTIWGPWLFALAATVSFWLGGCYEQTSGHVSVVATGVIGADDYVYYPGSEVYYSPAHRYYMYYDRGAWVHRPEPPHVWVREAPSVTIHLQDSPERHHPEVIRQYPHNWRPPAKTPPGKEKEHHDHDDKNDHDDHDDHDRK
jgi:hypothetical protein